MYACGGVLGRIGHAVFIRRYDSAGGGARVPLFYSRVGREQRVWLKFHRCSFPLFAPSFDHEENEQLDPAPAEDHGNERPRGTLHASRPIASPPTSGARCLTIRPAPNSRNARTKTEGERGKVGRRYLDARVPGQVCRETLNSTEALHESRESGNTRDPLRFRRGAFNFQRGTACIPWLVCASPRIPGSRAPGKKSVLNLRDAYRQTDIRGASMRLVRLSRTVVR